MGRQHRLGPLQMGVAGQDHVGVGVAAGDKGPLERRPAAVDLVDGLADPEPQVGGDLVVAAAGGVEFPARVAEAVHQGPLDVHVDVFQFACETGSGPAQFPGECRPTLAQSAGIRRR